MTNAIDAFGTLLQRGDGATPESFTTIGEVGDIEGPELETDTEDVTNHSSTGGYEEVIGTILRTGEVTFPVNYIPTNATHNATTGLLLDWKNKTLRNFQLVFPDGSSTTWSFSAIVTAFAPQAPVAGKLGADVTLKLSGQPTLA